MNTLGSARCLWLSAFSLGLVVLWSAGSARSDTDPLARPVEPVQQAAISQPTGDTAGLLPVLQFEIVPVLPPEGEAPYPTGTAIEGNEIRLPACAEEAWFEVRLRNLGTVNAVAAMQDEVNDDVAAVITAACTDDNWWSKCSCGQVAPCYEGQCCVGDTCYSVWCQEQCSACQGDYDANKTCSDPCEVTSAAPQEVTEGGLQPSTTSRATPGPACLKSLSVSADPAQELLPDSTSTSDPDRCLPRPELLYPYTGAIAEIADPLTSPVDSVVYFATIRAGFFLADYCENCEDVIYPPGGTVSGVDVLNDGFSFEIDLDPAGTFVNDENQEPIPFQTVPGVMIVGPTTSGAPVPAVSVWGLVLIALGLFVTARIYFGRRQVKAA